MFMWKYDESEICKRNALPVAVLEIDAIPVLYVYESGNHHYTQLSDDFSFFEMFSIYYTCEVKLLKEKYSKDFLNCVDKDELKLLLLKEGCHKILENFMQQYDNFKKVLSLVEESEESSIV